MGDTRNPINSPISIKATSSLYGNTNQKPFWENSSNSSRRKSKYSAQDWWEPRATRLSKVERLQGGVVMIAGAPSCCRRWSRGPAGWGSDGSTSKSPRCRRFRISRRQPNLRSTRKFCNTILPNSSFFNRMRSCSRLESGGATGGAGGGSTEGPCGAGAGATLVPGSGGTGGAGFRLLAAGTGLLAAGVTAAAGRVAPRLRGAGLDIR